MGLLWKDLCLLLYSSCTSSKELNHTSRLLTYAFSQSYNSSHCKHLCLIRFSSSIFFFNFANLSSIWRGNAEKLLGKVLGYMMEVLFWVAPFPAHCVSFIVRERVHTTQGTQSLPQAHGYRLRPTYFISVRALSKIKKTLHILMQVSGFLFAQNQKSLQFLQCWWCANTKGTTVIIGPKFKRFANLKKN